AIELLEKIKTLTAADLPPKVPFSKTSLFDTQYHYDRKVYFSHSELALRQIAQYVSLHHPHFPELQFQALNQALVSFLAKILRVEVKVEEVQQEKKRFCQRL